MTSSKSDQSLRSGDSVQSASPRTHPKAPGKTTFLCADRAHAQQAGSDSDHARTSLHEATSYTHSRASDVIASDVIASDVSRVDQVLRGRAEDIA